MGSALLAVMLALVLNAVAQAQYLGATDRVHIVLNTARSAFNDGHYTLAAEKFREYIRAGAGGRMEMASARYGLAVCLIEGPAKDYAGAIDLLVYPSGIPTFKERPYALYYSGVAYRGVGDGLHSSASTRPAASQPSLRRYGDVRLTYAVSNFAAAAEAFIKSAPEVTADGKEVPAEYTWAARSRCEQADLLIRLNRFKEAAVAAGEVLSHPAMSRTNYREYAAYYRGYACFGVKDYAEATRALSTLAPFEQPNIGVHARYLLARIHHVSGERPEAIANYQMMISQWEEPRQRMQTLATQPSTPAAQKEQMQASLAAPVPEYIARAMFYWGVALSEFGQPDEATTKLLACLQLAPQATVAPEARLRIAINGVVARRFKDAAAAVEPICEDPQYADQALRYLAKAQYGIGTIPVPLGKGMAAIMNAQPDPVALANGIKLAITTAQKADEKAQAAIPADPPAAARRAVILLELGDLLQLDKRYKDAAAAYANVTKIPQAAADVAEAALLRQAIALQMAQEFAASDKVCLQFNSLYPRSANRPEAMLRYAENALFAAYGAANPAAANSDGSKAPYAEAIQRFNRVITRCPDTPQANLARMGLATIHYLMGRYKEAAGVLNQIPECDRGGEMAPSALMLADCQLRSLPTEADDALSSARLASQLENIITQLETYVQAYPNETNAVEAYLRMGFAANKLAALMADPLEKRRSLARARRSYATIIGQFKNHPLYPVAMLELAKMNLGYYGASGSAVVAELQKFQAEPLNKTGLAPLAMVHLADAYRVRRKPEDALALLAQVRAEHETAMLKDAERSAWVPVMRYIQALALKESGKYEQAKEMLEQIARDFPNRPEAAEAPWRIMQCKMDPAILAVEANRKALLNAGKLEAQQEALANLLESAKALRAAAEEMGRAGEALAAKDSESEVALKMTYDAAWCWRVVGEVEVDAARRRMQLEQMEKTAQRLSALDPTRPVPVTAVPRPEIALSAISLQPGEIQARAKYKAVIEATVESPLIDEARMELADVLSHRGDHDGSIALYKEAISNAGAPDLADRLRLRMATMMLDKQDARGALDTVNEIMASGRVIYAGYAKLTAVEAAYQLKDWNAVIENAKVFLEVKAMGRVVGVADHALMRMAFAQQHLNQWDQSRNTLEMLMSRFPTGTHVYEARFAMGRACEQVKDFEKAIANYVDVAQRNGGELGVKAHFQIGLCKMALGKPAEAVAPFLTVAYAYDCPALNGAALCEAAKALKLAGDPDQARTVLRRAIRDFPNSQWATAAKKQLSEM